MWTWGWTSGEGGHAQPIPSPVSFPERRRNQFMRLSADRRITWAGFFRIRDCTAGTGTWGGPCPRARRGQALGALIAAGHRVVGLMHGGDRQFDHPLRSAAFASNRTEGQVFWILRGQTPPPSRRPTLGLAPNGSSKAAEGRRTPQADRPFASRPGTVRRGQALEAAPALVHGGDRQFDHPLRSAAFASNRTEGHDPHWGTGLLDPASGRPTLGLAPNGSSKAAEGRRTP
jgi:hypothetical protein